MFVIRHSTFIHAPLERCFALSTSVEIVRKELHMTPVEGRTSGLVRAGDIVRWQGMQLGFKNFHVSEIINFDPPHFFSDRMIVGRFRQFQHDHCFIPTEQGTILRDEIRFSLPFGPAGWAVGAFILCPHISKLLHRRFRLIKQLAESNEWRAYVPA